MTSDSIAAWRLTWGRSKPGEEANLYFTEADARRAEWNVRAYSGANWTDLTPLYAASPPSSPLKDEPTVSTSISKPEPQNEAESKTSIERAE